MSSSRSVYGGYKALAAALFVSVGLPTLALAAGGTGGSAGTDGGTGGMGPNGGNGLQGTSGGGAGGAGGGGGGGAGSGVNSGGMGGSGGDGDDGNGAPGGAGGNAANMNGSTGRPSANDFGAGGGGGGYAALNGNFALIGAGTTTGGAGGAGGAQTNGTYGGAGGGGGEGGYGAVVTTAGTNSNTATLQGGAGGNGGGSQSGGGGAGGDGGIGAYFSAAGSSLTNSGTITGGQGGALGSGDGFNLNGGTGGIGIFGAGLTINNNGGAILGGTGGAGVGGGQEAGGGGIGIVGSNLTIANTGTISGGMSGAGAGAVQADAIDVTGGANTLTLNVATLGTLNGNIGVDGAATNLTLLTTGGTIVIPNAITGAGSVIASADPASNQNNSVQLNGVNTYTGATSVQGSATQFEQLGIAGSILNSPSITLGARGELFVETAGALATTVAITMTDPSAALVLQRSTQIGSLNGTGFGVSFSNAANVLTTGTNNTNDTFNGNIGFTGGNGALTKIGTGTFKLTGANSYTGATAVNAGTLEIDGSLAATPTTVANGATFAGTGTSAGTVTVQGGGTLAPGAAGAGNIGTLTVAGLTLSAPGAMAGSTLAFDLSAPNVVGGTTNDLIKDNGALTLAGTLAVNQLAGFGAGAYRIANYTGVLTNNGLAVTGAPAGSVVQSGNGQVNLLVAGANGIGQYWNGATTTPNGMVNGGTGSWTNAAANTNWTDANGAFSESWASGTGIFAGAAGTVMVNDAIAFQALEFATTGYTVAAGNGTLTATGAGLITTDPGITATIAAPIGGMVGLTKAGTGMLILTAANTYTGGTSITAGTLQLGNGGATGSIVGNVADAGTLAFNRSDVATFAGTVSGTGAVTQVGTGTTILTAANTYTGGTSITAGTLQLGNGGATGSIVGNVADAGTLAFNRSDVATFAGIVSGTGAVTQIGAGTTVLTAANTYTGGTTITAGTLQLGNGGATGSIVGNVADAGTLAFDRSDVATFAGIVSGAGGVNQIGTGTTILTATNTYTGGTTIQAGTLQLGNGGATGSIVGNVADAGTLAFDRSDVATFAGIVSGTGAVTQIGAGTTVLTAANTYTGGTTITAGTLQLGNGGATGSIVGNVADAGTLAFDRSDVATFGGVVSGAGAVTQIGTGTTILTATNTYTGGTTISAGTLQLGNGGATGSIAGNVADAGTLAFDRSDVSTFAGTVSGAGAVTQIGTGTTVLTATNTYTGGTAITAGTLQFGNGGATGSIVGNVADAGTLAFDRSDVSTFAGTVSGTGAVTQIGTGTTVLTAANTYTGGTTISAGTLQLGNGGATGSIAGNVADAGTLAFNRPDVATFAGTVSGTGAVTQIGTGTTVLTAANSYTGATAVTAGTLLVNGSIATSSGVTVAAGATLGGSGTVAPTMVGAGTLSPGPAMGTIGTLTVAGNAIFTGASTYAVTVSPIAASLTNATGGATLAGTVAATFQNGGYVGKTYTILTAAKGVAGTFNTLATANMPTGFTASLSYDADNAFLNLAAINLTTAIGTGGLTPNQTNVANALNGYFNRGGALPPGFVGVFGLNGPALAGALSQLSGEGITAAQSVAHRSGELFTSTITDQTTFYGGAGGAANSITLSDAAPGAPLRELADLPATHTIPVAPAPRTRTWRAWATGFGGIEDIQGNASLGSNSVNSTLYGGSLGVDYQLTPDYLAGIAVGGSDGEFSLPTLATSGSTTGGHVAFYDLATFGAFYGASSTGFSYYTNKTTRTAITGTERGDFDSHEFRSRVEFGRHFGYAGAVVTVFVALEIADFRSNGFNETTLSGANVFGLDVQGQSTPSVPSFVGARYQQAFVVGNGMIFAPSLQLAYVHEFAPERSQIAGFEALPGATFLVDGARPDRDAAQIKAGAELSIGPASALFASFDSEISGHAQFYAGKGGLKIGW